MKLLHMLKMVALSLAVYAAPVSASTIIDFDGKSHGAVVGNEYAGVSISGGKVARFPFYNFIGYPPASGRNVIYNYLDSVIEFTFSSPVTSVGAYVTGRNRVRLSAYDGATLLGRTSVGPGFLFNPNQFLGFSAANITRVVFSDRGGHSNSFSLDDFSFTAGAAVPEPATWALMIIGFGATGAAMRRRKAGPRFANA